MRKVLLFAMLLPLLAGCLNDDDYVDYAALDEEIISEYLAENNIQAERHSSGVYYKVINQGDGTSIGDDPQTDEKITFSYKGYLTNGTVFDDSKGKNLTLNLFSLIPGFQIGVQQTNRLGEVQIFIPSSWAYGSSQNGSIPANSVVIFDVKVDRDQMDIDEDIISAFLEENSITAERDESGLYYEIVKEGDGDNVPANAYVDIKFKGTLLNGDEFISRTQSNFLFTNYIEAWKIGIPKAKKNGIIRLYCPSQLAFGHTDQYDDNKELILPGNSVVIYEIEVVNFN